MSRRALRDGRGGSSTAGRAALVALALVGLAVGCRAPGDGRGRSATEETASLDSLRVEVQRLRDELDARLATDSLFEEVNGGAGAVAVGLSTELLTRVLHAATLTYLDDVRLRLDPGVEVSEGEDVTVRIGPVRVPAGRWEVRVRVMRIEATLRADTVELAVAGDDRMEAFVPVRVHEGSGRATIGFRWDATTAASVVCRDFAVQESFRGTVSPYTERLEATLVLEAEGARIVARPRYTGPRLSVRPEPTPDAWRRVREILDRQNAIFRCGLAISPDELERRMRGLLRRGFRFEFPESVLQPVELPTAFTEAVTVEGRTFGVVVRPVALRLGPERLWYDVEVGLVAREDRLDPALVGG